MASCGDHFKEETRRAAAALTPEERMQRALAIGKRDLEFFATVSGQTVEQARQVLAARRASDRRTAQKGWKF
jgi:hypothetical protein